MHTETGQIRDYSEIYDLPESERQKFVPINRDLTHREKLNQRIALYSQCGCGSGKKFKFCCHRKPQTP